MKKQLRKPVLLLLTVAILVATTGGYYLSTGKTPEQRYKLQTVEKGELNQSVSANGTLNPVILVNVGTQVSGTVKKLYVDFNSKVAQGQILMELDDALFSAQVKQSQANVASAAATLDLADANEARARKLFAQEYISQQDLDTSVQAKKAAQAQLQTSRAQLDRDKANLAYSVIRSPVSGVVVARNIDIGQTVAASFQTPTLFQIAQDLSKMQIDSSFAEADIGNIRVGQTVRFNVDAFPNRSFTAEVKQLRLNPTTVQNVVTYDVVIAVDNPEKILLPGMTAYVSIIVAQRHDALLVPNAALRYKPSDPASAKPDEKRDAGKRKQDAYSGTIYVLRNGKPMAVAVTLGITDNRNTEIVSGELKVGDQLIIADVQASDTTSTNGSGPRMRLF
ncbi:MAG TPA: efflux RND transporter periplasmic adaptor subunit [Gallionella sp.]|nr:efflux RND transporter periplasmic adaptor subunit [Gallionella sp.]